MAISTYKTFLMKKGSGTGATYAKLVDIKNFSDLGGKPELLDTTTLSNGARTYINGIQSQEAITFTGNYTKADYTTLKALDGVDADYSVWFGGTESNGVVTPTGSDGKFDFSGRLSVYVNGGDVNEVVNLTISIAPTTEVVESST